MADILIDNQSVASTPAAGKSVIYVDSTTKKLANLDDAGFVRGILSRNTDAGSQTANAADTYLAGSSLLIPSSGMRVGQLYRITFTATKTAAGTAQAIYTIRTGANQSVADTSRLALTATTAQTAAVSSGLITVVVGVRTLSATGVITGGVAVGSNNAGLGSGISGVSGTFDNTALQGLYLGLSVNPGTLGVWTIEMVNAELIG